MELRRERSFGGTAVVGGRLWGIPLALRCLVWNGRLLVSGCQLGGPFLTGRFG